MTQIRIKPIVTAALTITILHALRASADVRLPAIFSEHMVLQSDTLVPIWGWADPGEKVTVTIADQSQTTTADDDGKWRVNFDKLVADGPVTLKVVGKSTLSIEDVLIGEVWLASGQSNMQLPVNAANKAWLEIKSARFPKIRMFTVDRKTAEEPKDDCGGKWIVCSPETVMHFSAAGYFFARNLYENLDTPIGVINSSWGGTTIEAWTSMEAQKDTPELTPIFKKWQQKVQQKFDQGKADARYGKQMEVWEKQSAKAKAAGTRPPQQPKKPVAPRLESNHPANLFNGMIAPLIPYAIRGAIWYQGESNSVGNGPAPYATQLPMMIKDWRQRWGRDDFPFVWVQLPNFKARSDDPGAASNWALMREVFLKQLKIPNTGMAITIDSGDEKNIHPKDKQTVGKRLALWTRATVYQEDIPYSGPLPSGHEVKGGEIVISFTHATDGLKAKDGKLSGFAIAGSDRKWVWANARIDADTVIVSSPKVSSPVAVRYAWGDNPECNLINGAGLPATPFRTDNW